MARYRVSCINKDDRYNAYERIRYIGGLLSGGGPWKISQADAIAHINNRTHSFYVSVGGNEVEVITAVSPFNNWYIKTEADGQEPNNLLSLPECP